MRGVSGSPGAGRCVPPRVPSQRHRREHRRLCKGPAQHLRAGRTNAEHRPAAAIGRMGRNPSARCSRGTADPSSHLSPPVQQPASASLHAACPGGKRLCVASLQFIYPRKEGKKKKKGSSQNKRHPGGFLSCSGLNLEK